MRRRRVQPEETIEVSKGPQDRDLVLEHTSANPEYANRLQAMPGRRQLVGHYTLEDLEDLFGYIAAEANHTEDAKVRKRLDALHERLLKIQRSYDDGNWQDSET